MQITEIIKYVQDNTNSAFFYTPNIYMGGRSYLFKNPWKILKAKNKQEVESLLIHVDELITNPNLIGFATIPYEIGYYFQPKKIADMVNTEMCFYFYEKKNVSIIDSENINFDDVENYFNTNNNANNFKLDITQTEYVEKINRIKKYIADGDTYQINLTTKARFTFNGELISLFLNGIFNQSANYSVLINNESEFILSFSPELFFSTDYKNIFSKPMKGTLKRKGDPIKDKKLGDSLLNDEKNLAENVMIVDLMRNDISKISEIDSVKVEKLFEIEKYETLYQLTSTVVGQLKDAKLSTIIKNLFPCGSITGAPKIRSMQIIAELEKRERNLYTGSIGLFTNEKAVFNIPIRTVNITKQTGEGVLGLGSGIVWDSNAESEYKEVLLKGKFITSQQNYFELLETFLYEEEKYFLIDYHIKRLENAAKYFLFKFDKAKIINELKKQSFLFKTEKKYKVKLLLSKWGSLKIEYEEINNVIKKAKVILSKISRCYEDKFLYHKTTNRPWDKVFSYAKNNGFAEVIFINENNELLEGAITNLLIKKDDKLFTPPINLGLLNGCYRQHLIDNKICEEKILTLEDLEKADKIILCNSVRKEIIVNEVFDDKKKPLFKF